MLKCEIFFAQAYALDMEVAKDLRVLPSNMTFRTLHRKTIKILLVKDNALEK